MFYLLASAQGTEKKVYAQPCDWENPHIFGINKLPYHATLQLPSREAECKEIVSLDGQWAFHWLKDPDSRVMDFWQTDYDVTEWNKIAVPGNWQMQGFGFWQKAYRPWPSAALHPRLQLCRRAARHGSSPPLRP